jgi:rubrerythrin
MPINFNESKTKENLMRAFAGESQARNRYTFAASTAKSQNLHVIEAIFSFTAGQEKEHAEIFYNYLKDLTGEKITVDGDYPVNVTNSVVELLQFAEENEFEEYNPVYKEFGDVAKEEGFSQIATTFHNIAEIEKSHAERFKMFKELLQQNKLFVSDVKCKWICLNCGFVFEGTSVPEQCPVCSHDKGYFIRIELAPYTK